MKIRNRSSVLVLGAAAVLGACTSDSVTSVDPDAAASQAAASSALRTYEVTITNLTKGQPFTPPLVATHDSHAVDLFDVGAPASKGLQEIAENGNLGPMHTRLLSADGVGDVVIAATSVGPLLPGASVTFTIQGRASDRLLSFASMMICSNDGFAGIDSGRLPWRVGQTFEGEGRGYDAGTEINTELFADIVPPCPLLTNRPTSAPGTGMSNPALAENGVITMHKGIAGFADLEPGLHGFTQPVVQIRVTRTS